MTSKEVETVAVLLKRARERADHAKSEVTRVVHCFGNLDITEVSPGYVEDLAEGLKSLVAAIEMVTIELAEVRAEIEGARFAARKHERR